MRRVNEHTDIAENELLLHALERECLEFEH